MSTVGNPLSEATTQFNNPHSDNFSKSKIENLPFNSYLSPRQDSVTVIGKKIFSYSCISPQAIEEKPRYPIPIKVMTRLKRQSSQAKTLIKRKTLKNLKIKCLEPVVKNLVIPNPLQLKHQSKEKPQTVKKKIICEEEKKEKKRYEKSPKSQVEKLIRNSILTEIKKKKREENLQSRERKKELNKKLLIDERNTKIRLENSSKFKMSKFKPKVPWGVDTRWVVSNEKALTSIKKQRTARRALKQSPEYQKKKSIGLSEFIEIGEEIGFKRCRSSDSKRGASPKSCVKRSPNPEIRDFMKLKKKKNKENKRNAVIEEVKKETKRVQNLKKLDVGMKVAKNKFILNDRESRIKYIEKDNEIKRIYNEDSFEEEELKHLEKQFISYTENSEKIPVNLPLKTRPGKKFNDLPFSGSGSGSEDSLSESLEEINRNSDIKVISGGSFGTSADKEKSKQDSLEIKNRAAEKLQKKIREFLKKKKLEKEHSKQLSNDNEVEAMLFAWKNMRDELASRNIAKAPENLEESKTQELKKIKTTANDRSGNPEQPSPLKKGLGNRRNQLTDIFQQSTNDNNIQLDYSDSNKKENESSEKNGLINLSFPSYYSENSIESPESFTENMRKKIETLLNEKINIDENLSPISDANIFEVSSCVEGIGEFSEIMSKQKESLNKIIETKNSPVKDQKESRALIVSSEMISSLTEQLIEKLLGDIMSSDFLKKLPVNKSVVFYGKDLVSNLNEPEFNQWMNSPLERNPLSILKMMHTDDFGYSEEFYSRSGRKVLPLDFFNKVSSERTQNFPIGQAGFYQKLNDKLLFDSCNEVLDSLRLFGKNGKPMPWESSSIRLRQEFSVDKVMELVLALVEKMSKLDNGCFRSFDGSVFDKNYIEGKIRALLIRDILEYDDEWVNYTFEETQAYLNIGELVIEELIDEAIRFLRE